MNTLKFVSFFLVLMMFIVPAASAQTKVSCKFEVAEKQASELTAAINRQIKDLEKTNRQISESSVDAVIKSYKIIIKNLDRDTAAAKNFGNYVNACQNSFSREELERLVQLTQKLEDAGNKMVELNRAIVKKIKEKRE